MFRPEQLLGGLMTMGMDRRSKRRWRRAFHGGPGSMLGGGMNTALGFGALGVAMAAFDHFVTQKQGQAGAAPQPAQQWNPASSPTAPPPPPTESTMPPPTPLPSGMQAAVPSNDEAVLLVRAMIAAAYADGVLDADERTKIVSKLESAGLTDEERTFVTNELLNPADVKDIVAQANTPELAQQVYLVSLLAIETDTPQEKQYLKDLAAQLSLDAETVNRIHQELEIEPIA